MAGWHHWLNAHEFEQTPGNSDGQGSLTCCSPWGHKCQTWLPPWTTATQIGRNLVSGCHGPWLGGTVELFKMTWMFYILFVGVVTQLLEKETQPTSVFLPGESHGQWSLMGYSPWGQKELDMTEWLMLT